jgi:hypothetical protein
MKDTLQVTASDRTRLQSNHPTLNLPATTIYHQLGGNILFTTNLVENRYLFTSANSFTPPKASTFAFFRGRRKAVCILVASSRHSMCADETHRFAETSTEGGWIGKVQCFAQNDTLLLLVLSNPHRYI